MQPATTKAHPAGPAGWIFFDAECRFCVASRRRWGRVFESCGFVWEPLQSPGAAERLGVTPELLRAELWLLPAGGRPLSGVSAWIALMRRVWWMKPFALALDLPGIRYLAGVGYRWFARHRYCLAGRCDLQTGQPHSEGR
jgi:predicted DCC family thiol-disulfide oxidoreductase YuxK